LNVAGSEQEGELETAKPKTIRVRNEIFGRISNLRQKHKHTKVYTLLSVSVQRRSSRPMHNKLSSTLVEWDQNRTAGFSVIDLDGSET